MGADVGICGDGFWVESGFCEGELDSAYGLSTFGVGLGEMEGVAGGASGEDFGPCFSAAFSEVFFGFEDEDGGPFAHDEATAIGIEGPHGLFGSVVAGLIHGAHIDEGGDTEAGEGGFGAAGDDEVGVTAAEVFEGIDHGMPGRGAGAAGGVGGAADAECEADIAWGCIGHEHGDGEGANAGGAAGE